MLYTGGVTDMMEFISLFSTIMGICVVASLLYLRWTKPKEPRPYKVYFKFFILQGVNVRHNLECRTQNLLVYSFPCIILTKMLEMLISKI